MEKTNKDEGIALGELLGMGAASAGMMNVLEDQIGKVFGARMKKPEPKKEDPSVMIIKTFVGLIEDKYEAKIALLERQLEDAESNSKGFEQMADARGEALQKTVEELDATVKELKALKAKNKSAKKKVSKPKGKGGKKK